MTRWEVRGLFGNEYAMEKAVEELKKLKGVDFKILDRRNLQVMLRNDDEKARGIVANIIKIAHGYIESEAPLGEYDKVKERERALRFKQLEEKAKRVRSVKTAGVHEH